MKGWGARNTGETPNFRPPYQKYFLNTTTHTIEKYKRINIKKYFDPGVMRELPSP